MTPLSPGGEITHRRFARSQTFSEEGITLSTWLRPRYFTLPWSAVAFVCPTPSVEEVDGTWRFRRNPFPEIAALNEPPGGYKWFHLDIVVHDWRRARPRRSLSFFRPLAPPEDRAGTLSMYLYVRNLSAPPSALFALLARHTRFDLLIRDF